MVLTSNKTVWKILSMMLISLIALFYGIYYLSSIFIVFVTGAIMIIISDKFMILYQKALEKIKISKKVKKISGYFIAFFLTMGLLFLFGNSFVDVLNTLKNVNEDANTNLELYYNENLQQHIPLVIDEYVFTQENIKSLKSYILNLISTMLSGLGTFIFNSVLIIPLMFAIYFKNKNKIPKVLSKHVPRKFHQVTQNSLRTISTNLQFFLDAKGIESFAIAMICSIGFYFSGIKGWFFLGVLAGLLNVIPYFGPLMGAILPILIGFNYNITTVYMIIGTIIFAQLVDNFYLIPFMISSRVNMDSLLSIVLILVGAKLFGIFGMVFIIPMYLVSKIILIATYKQLVKTYDPKRLF
jgi:predicted PurR-regulated permease PerM